MVELYWRPHTQLPWWACARHRGAASLTFTFKPPPRSSSASWWACRSTPTTRTRATRRPLVRCSTTADRTRSIGSPRRCSVGRSFLLFTMWCTLSTRNHHPPPNQPKNAIKFFFFFRCFCVFQILNFRVLFLLFFWRIEATFEQLYASASTADGRTDERWVGIAEKWRAQWQHVFGAARRSARTVLFVATCSFESFVGCVGRFRRDWHHFLQFWWWIHTKTIINNS